MDGVNQMEEAGLRTWELRLAECEGRWENLPVTSESPRAAFVSTGSGAGCSGRGAGEECREPVEKMIPALPGSVLSTPAFLGIEELRPCLKESLKSFKPRVLNDSFNSFNKYHFTLMRTVKI